MCTLKIAYDSIHANYEYYHMYINNNLNSKITLMKVSSLYCARVDLGYAVKSQSNPSKISEISKPQ